MPKNNKSWWGENKYMLMSAGSANVTNKIINNKNGIRTEIITMPFFNGLV